MRREGITPRSGALTFVAMVWGALGVGALAAEALWEHLKTLTTHTLRHAGTLSEPQQAIALLHKGAASLWTLSWPLWSVLIAAATLTLLTHVGFAWHPSTLFPKLARLGPRTAQPDRVAADAALRSLLALSLTLCGAGLVWSGWHALARNPWTTPAAATAFLGDLAWEAAWQTAVLLTLYALADAILKRTRWQRDVMMTRRQKDKR